MRATRRGRIGSAVGAVIVAALVLAGCGEETGPAIDTGLEGSACSYVDVAAVEEFYGAESEVEMDNEAVCRLAVDSAGAEVRFTPGMSGADFQSTVDERPDAESVEDLGDDAFYSPSLMTATFLKDDLIVSVQAFGGPGTTDEVADFVIAQARAIDQQL